MITPENNFENNEVPKITPENLETKKLSQEEFLNWLNKEEKTFKNESIEQIDKSNSLGLNKETFEKIKNETGVEQELSNLDIEAENYVNEARNEIREQPEFENSEIKEDGMQNVTKKVQELYINLAEKYLDDENPLKAKIINFYSDFDRLQNELKVVFKGLREEEIYKKIEEVEERLNDRTFFIEHYQKIFERIEVFNNIKDRMQKNPLATQEEYDLGVYKEGLEAQVRDACFLLQKKGYKTFESGFREKEGDRDQYVGMYNKNINIPESVINYFKEKQFEISVIHHDDRTVVNIHPESSNAVTLEEWKNIWNDLVDKLPMAKKEDFNDRKKYLLHTSFRERQDNLRARKRFQI